MQVLRTPPWHAHNARRLAAHSEVKVGENLREVTRFLIVEDHAFQRMSLEQALRSLGHAFIVAAGDGAEAMRLLGTIPIDIVITDLRMPGVDGIELIHLLRKSAPSAAVILSSADRTSLEAASAIAIAHGVRLLGSVDKPITPHKLRPLLAAYLADQPLRTGDQ